jgi:hypothetical protein
VDNCWISTLLFSNSLLLLIITCDRERDSVIVISYIIPISIEVLRSTSIFYFQMTPITLCDYCTCSPPFQMEEHIECDLWATVCKIHIYCLKMKILTERLDHQIKRISCAPVDTSAAPSTCCFVWCGNWCIAQGILLIWWSSLSVRIFILRQYICILQTVAQRSHSICSSIWNGGEHVQ